MPHNVTWIMFMAVVFLFFSCQKICDNRLLYGAYYGTFDDKQWRIQIIDCNELELAIDEKYGILSHYIVVADTLELLNQDEEMARFPFRRLLIDSSLCLIDIDRYLDFCRSEHKFYKSRFRYFDVEDE